VNKSQLSIIIALGTTQTLAWASSYYLPAILAAPIARDLGVTPTFIFGALSGALVIAGLLGPRVGSFIDAFGGRGLLAVSNLVLAAGLRFAPSTSMSRAAHAWRVAASDIRHALLTRRAWPAITPRSAPSCAARRSTTRPTIL